MLITATARAVCHQHRPRDRPRDKAAKLRAFYDDPTPAAQPGMGQGGLAPLPPKKMSLSPHRET